MRKHSIILSACFALIMTAAAAIWLASAAQAGSKGSGRANVKEIPITKYNDVSSPMMRKSSTTKKLRTPLTVRKAGGQQE